MIKLLLVLFFTVQTFSQNTTLKGKLLDKETNKPIAFANISFVNINNGISSNEDGLFFWEVDKKWLDEEIHISCLNYKDTVVLAKQINNKVLKLYPKTYVLDEIVLQKKIQKEFEIDAYTWSDFNSGFGTIKNRPWIVTKFFKYHTVYKKTPYLKKITIYTKNNKKSKSGKFRLRLYSLDTLENKPAKDLLTSQVIINAKKRKNKIEIDVSKYNIEIPENGFFVGFEWLYIAENFYKVKVFKNNHKKDKYKETFISPHLKGVKEKNKNTWVFSNGAWYKLQFLRDKKETIIPAISVTLSN